MFVETLIFLATLTTLIWYFFHTSYQYWSRKKVPSIPPRFPVGNSISLLPKSASIGTASKKFYDYFRHRKNPFGGIYLFTTPNLILIDPSYIKDILTKDHHIFTDRGSYTNERVDPITTHLFSVDNPRWKPLRAKLTPTFTSGKLKTMFSSMLQCSDYMIEAMEKSAKLGKDIDTKDFIKGFTIDVIGTCAFGVSCNSFKEPEAEFKIMAGKIFEKSIWRRANIFLQQNLPELSKCLGLRVSTDEITKFFKGLVEETVKVRKEGDFSRNDFIQLLMDLNKEKEVVTIMEMTAQVFLFFVAGFDTSSTAMTFALYELARNQTAQKKLRDEIELILGENGNITYENIKEMKYLGQVLNEALRMYPPLPNLSRRSVQDYQLRNTDVIIEKGTLVHISTLGLHMDPEYFPEPETFKPERFSEENKHTIEPYTYLPFGDGPRNCIGLRFGELQAKIGILTTIKNFQLTVSPQCKPVELDPDVFLLNSINKVLLRAEKI